MQKFKYLYLGIFICLLALVLLYSHLIQDKAILISSSYLNQITHEAIPNNAKIKDDYLYFNIHNQTYKIAKDSIDLQEFGKKVPIEIQSGHSYIEKSVEMIFYILLSLGLLYVFFKLINLPKPALKDQNNKQPNQSKALSQETYDLQRIQPIQSNITFDDVAGIHEAKEELEEIIDYLKSPQKYQDFGVRLPKGVLLIGPPGVGKTLIAKALATEAGVPFFYQSGASFVQIYVGMGAKKVHDLFTKAKIHAPSIIFIDEIDAVGKARGGMRNDEREATLNQLLTEMDGFEDSKGVIVIGATNNIESMDEALLRSGRFDRRVYVELPNIKERIKILKVHARGKNCDFNFEEVARLCVGFSGAALSSLINEAALHAIKRNSPTIQKEDILATREKVILGTKKKLSFSEKEKEILAFYQGAKAFSAYWLEIPFEKVTLMNDGLKYLDKEFLSKNELKNQIKVHLSGIAALELLFDEQYAYAKDDLTQAKSLASKMVELYGMGEFLIGKPEDSLKILEECKHEMFDFFQSYSSHLQAIQDKLLIQEKLEYDEVGIILKERF